MNGCLRKHPTFLSQANGIKRQPIMKNSSIELKKIATKALPYLSTVVKFATQTTVKRTLQFYWDTTKTRVAM